MGFDPLQSLMPDPLDTHVDALVSVARKHIASRRFAEAQQVLVGAGQQAPGDPRVYRWLGEVLLRRGDAGRAVKVLERAWALGARDDDARSWLERARVYQPMQASAGEAAVAADLAVAAEGMREKAFSVSELPTAVKAAPPGRPAAARAFPSEGPTAVNGARSTLAAPAKVPVERRTAFGAANGERRTARGEAPGSGPPIPYPRDVLDALALVGVYEPQPAAQRSPVPSTWTPAGRREVPRGRGALAAAMFLFAAASVGTFFFYKQRRAVAHREAEVTLAQVELLLERSKPDELPAAERAIASALSLESRSPRAALDWLRERAMSGLLKGGADIAFEEALTRAKDVGVAEERTAFARVASFLFQGDTAGAAAVLPRWDRMAADDATYQLVAGATLERVGDPSARERYATAAKLRPELVLAREELARTTALAGDAPEARRLASELHARLPDRAEPAALVALAWGLDPHRESTPAPAEVDVAARRAGELPVALRFVPPAASALEASDRRADAEARADLERALALTDAPGAAVWLGAIALDLPSADPALGRRAALDALRLSAAYAPARALAARVALQAGHLDEALKATEELDPSSLNVAVVRAAAAYERSDIEGIDRALLALGPQDRALPAIAALATAHDALLGKLHLDRVRLAALADDGAPWGDLVAMDAALDAGDLASADAIASTWRGSDGSPLRAERLAELARARGHLDSAEPLSQAALGHATVTPRILQERVFELVARGQASEVPGLLARYPLVLGPVSTWLSAYASASAGALEAAKGKTATLDLLPKGAPVRARIVVAAALGAMRDKNRGLEVVRDLLSNGTEHPDLVAAATALGLRRVEHAKR